jgi:type I restriction enzyme S subunit
MIANEAPQSRSIDPSKQQMTCSVEIDGSGDLPEGWSLVSLGDGLLADIQPGFACGVHNRGGHGIAHIRPMNVSADGRIDMTDVKFIDRSLAVRDERCLRRGDVIFNNTNSPALVGKTAIYDDDEPRAFSNHMTRLRVRPDRVYPAYLALVLHQLWREGYFADRCNNHVSQASISRRVLLQTEIALPPLAEQRRIVDNVNELLARVNAARDRLSQVPGILGRFRQAVLAAACSGRLTEDWREQNGSVSPSTTRFSVPNRRQMKEISIDLELPDLPLTYGKATIGEVSSLIQYGTSDKAGTFAPGLIPVLRMGNIQDGCLTFDDLKFMAGSTELRNLMLRSGDLLFNRTNSPELVGKSAVFRTTQPMTFASYLIRLQFLPELVVPEFVCYWINSSWGREWAQLAKTDGVSQSNINGTKLSTMQLPLPPVAEQAEIVRRVESLFALADSIERRLKIVAARVETSTQAILAQAFRGELVPTEAELARGKPRV